MTHNSECDRSRSAVDVPEISAKMDPANKDMSASALFPGENLPRDPLQFSPFHESVGRPFSNSNARNRDDLNSSTASGIASSETTSSDTSLDTSSSLTWPELDSSFPSASLWEDSNLTREDASGSPLHSTPEDLSPRIAHPGSSSVSSVQPRLSFQGTPRPVMSPCSSGSPIVDTYDVSFTREDGLTPPIPILGAKEGVEYVSCAVVRDVLEGKHLERLDKVTIIDCRYDYEYKGGHIRGAINISEMDDLQAFYQQCRQEEQQQQQQQQKGRYGSNGACRSVHQPRLVILHCELSSQRAPTLWSWLRWLDRSEHQSCYPKLVLPWLYVMQGGYREFFGLHPDACEPRSYTPMRDRAHRAKLLKIQASSPTWSSPMNKKKKSYHLRCPSSDAASSPSAHSSPPERGRVRRSLFS